MCHILEDKGHLKSERDGPRRVYRPTLGHGRASRHALEDVVDTFFSGSPHRLVAALLDTHRDRLSPRDVARLRKMIEEGDES
jgi:predicted transcriptional regulator